MTNSKGKTMQLDEYQREVAGLVLDEGRTRDTVAKEYGHGWKTVDKWVSALMEERAAEHYEKVLEHAIEVDPEVNSDEHTSIVLDGGRNSEQAVGNITFGPNQIDPHDTAKDALDKFTAQLKESIERTKNHQEVLANLMERNAERKKESDRLTEEKGFKDVVTKLREQLEEMKNQREVLAELADRRKTPKDRMHEKYEAEINRLQQEVLMLKRLVSEMHEVTGVLINLIEMK